MMVGNLSIGKPSFDLPLSEFSVTLKLGEDGNTRNSWWLLFSEVCAVWILSSPILFIE